MIDLKVQIEGVDSINYLKEAQQMITKCNINYSTFMVLMKRGLENQKRSLRNKKRKKKLIIETKDDEEEYLKDRKSSTESMEKGYGQFSKQRGTSMRLRLEPLSELEAENEGPLTGKRTSRLSYRKSSESRDLKAERRKSKDSNNLSDGSRKGSEGINEGGSQKNESDEENSLEKEFKKSDTSEELMNFLKDYHKKLCHLYQTNIEESVAKLDKIIFNIYEKKKVRFVEYSDNFKEYITMGDVFKELIIELTSEYKKDLESYDTELEENLKNLYTKLSKINIKDNLDYDNLNIEALAAIIKLFK